MSTKLAIATETGQVWIRPIKSIRPSPENDRLYRPVDPNSDDIRALADSIRAEKLKEPIVITLDGYIVSGHRRYVAAKLAGLKSVPCRIEPINRCEDLDAFIKLLRTYNRQRVKSFDEQLRETLVDVNPNEAYTSLLLQREDRLSIEVEAITLNSKKARALVSDAKSQMVEAILKAIKDHRRFWPLSDRRIHYRLFNNAPLRHASKPKSRYANDRASYQDLCDLLTRMRLSGAIPFEAIADETRPVVIWDVHREPGTFLRREFDGLLQGYWRNLMQSQPNHVEVVVEKNTVAKICETVCGKYTIPMTSGRGYCSLPPRHAMAKRYELSGAEKLILLVVSDFDPEGESIAESFARSMRDDFGIRKIHPVKVALTADQVSDYELPAAMKVKKGSSRGKKFVARHGNNVWELEALEPGDLQQILEDAIESVIDLDAFYHEVEAEKSDATKIEGVRRTIGDTLKGFDFGEVGA
jgi:hypothetical protein